jgi:hypothetical protein
MPVATTIHMHLNLKPSFVLVSASIANLLSYFYPFTSDERNFAEYMIAILK